MRPIFWQIAGGILLVLIVAMCVIARNKNDKPKKQIPENV